LGGETRAGVGEGRRARNPAWQAGSDHSERRSETLGPFGTKMGRSAHGFRPGQLAQCGIAKRRFHEGGTGVSATEAAAPPKTVSDLAGTDKPKALLESGRENGQPSADEIAGALDEPDLEPAQIDDFSHALEELHIEVVSGPEEEEAPAEEPREVS